MRFLWLHIQVPGVWGAKKIMWRTEGWASSLWSYEQVLAFISAPCRLHGLTGVSVEVWLSGCDEGQIRAMAEKSSVENRIGSQSKPALPKVALSWV